jgi:hypothetical protein
MTDGALQLGVCWAYK